MRFNFRPAEYTPLSPLEKALEIIAAAGVVLSVLLLALRWSALPAAIPSHFGLSGAPDASGGKGMLAVMAAVNVVLYLLLTALSRIPRLFNYPWPVTVENARRQYQIGRTALSTMKAEFAWVLLYVEWQIIQIGLGKSQGFSFVFLPVVIFLQTVLFAYFIHLAYRER
ncbi:MAG: DUF1648 domain-containing protein [Armatimonadota bacterium]|nr:DUF1648 domain-containing protein [Armatimonadota bacterium]